MKPRKYYILYLTFDDNRKGVSGEIEVNGYPVKLQGWEQYEFIRHGRRGNWSISEVRSGAALVRGAATITQALEEAHLVLVGRTPEDVNKEISQWVAKYGERKRP